MLMSYERMVKKVQLGHNKTHLLLIFFYANPACTNALRSLPRHALTNGSQRVVVMGDFNAALTQQTGGETLFQNKMGGITLRKPTRQSVQLPNNSPPTSASTSLYTETAHTRCAFLQQQNTQKDAARRDEQR